MEFIGDSRELVKKTGALSGESGAQSRDREVLTRKTARDYIGVGEVVLPDSADVVEDLRLRELRGEQLAAVRVAFDDGDRLDPRALEA